MTKIEQYVKRHTPDNEFQSRVIQAYLDAMLGSDTILSAFAILQQYMTHDFIPNSFWKTASKFNDPILRALIAYSMLKKDKKLFDMVLYRYNRAGFVRMFIGRELFSSYVEFTDEEQVIDGVAQIAQTDTNLYTDMTSGLIYEGFIQVYREDDDEFGLDAPTFEEMLAREKEMSEFLIIVAPARVSLLLIHAPVVLFTYQPEFRHSHSVTVVENTLYTTANLNAFAQMSHTQIANCFPHELSLSDSSMQIPIDPSFVYKNGKFQATYYVQRDSIVVEDLQELWTTLQLHVEGYGNLYFNISNIRTQGYTTVYFAKIEFQLPCRGE